MYQPSLKDAWRGRIDAHDGELGHRWHQVMQFLDLSKEIPAVPEGKTAFAFLGFCCDEGVRRNQGRIGAVSGPPTLRGAMASFAHHLPEHVLLYDAGDVICSNGHLEEAQVKLGHKIGILLQNGYRPLVLGGGHETAYGHYLGLEQETEQKRLGILNFDAHFDLRNYEVQPSSGTPFLQIADRLRTHGRDFIYNCIGIQEYGNTRILFETAKRLGVNYTLAGDVQPHKLTELKENLKSFLDQVDAVYMTVDLDVFAAAYAPGVSATAALGVQPDLVLELLKYVAANQKLLSFDVVELNPSYDKDNSTAKLGASLLYHVVKEWGRTEAVS
ncbi:MAG: formimidoylglutamase [Hymenobacteraceae bacterium]|nr:formimidoylglutamase [Hymenobacteraceae bacterium]